MLRFQACLAPWLEIHKHSRSEVLFKIHFNFRYYSESTLLSVIFFFSPWIEVIGYCKTKMSFSRFLGRLIGFRGRFSCRSVLSRIHTKVWRRGQNTEVGFEVILASSHTVLYLAVALLQPRDSCFLAESSALWHRLFFFFFPESRRFWAKQPWFQKWGKEKRIYAWGLDLAKVSLKGRNPQGSGVRKKVLSVNE